MMVVGGQPCALHQVHALLRLTTMTAPLLVTKNLCCRRDKISIIFSRVDLVLHEGDVIVLQGKSGSGKTTLLKVLAHLSAYDGLLEYRGRHVGHPICIQPNNKDC